MANYASMDDYFLFETRSITEIESYQWEYICNSECPSWKSLCPENYSNAMIFSESWIYFKFGKQWFLLYVSSSALFNTNGSSEADINLVVLIT